MDFDCTVRSFCNGRRAAPLSVLAVLCLGIVAGAPSALAGEIQPKAGNDELVVSIEDASAFEGRPVEFRVSLSLARTVPLDVYWELSPDTAVEGLDYPKVDGGRLRIPAGDVEGFIRIRTLEDRVAEPDDEFVVRLVDAIPIPPDGALVSDVAHTATGTILNDDGDPTFPDVDLRRAVERALDTPAGRRVTAADLMALRQLELSNHQDSDVDLTGLEFAVNLEQLNVRGNGLTPDGLEERRFNLSALRHLGQLRVLYFQGVGVRDLTPLSNLKSLRRLDLRYNLISDLSPLAGLTSLEELTLRDNAISDISPLKRLGNLQSLYLERNLIRDLLPLELMRGLRLLNLNYNRVSDVSPLRHLTHLRELHMAYNAVSDVSPLRNLSGLDRLVMGANRVVDLWPLVSNPGFASGLSIYLYDNPLSDESRSFHVPMLRDSGARVFDTSVWVADASAVEGDALEFKVRLSAPVDQPFAVNYRRDPFGSATGGVDYSLAAEGSVTIPAGSSEGVIWVNTWADNREEPHETVLISWYGGNQQFPPGVSFRYDEDGRYDGRPAYGVGLILEPTLPVCHVPLLESASQQMREGLVRIINHERDDVTAVRIEAVDDGGSRPSAVTLDIRSGEAKHLRYRDLETGSVVKGLSGGISAGHGDWRLRLRSHQVEALSYARSRDGLLTSLHELIPLTSVGYFVPIFNPGSNSRQLSRLRLSNAGDRTASVRIKGVDDSGRSPGSEISFRLPPGQTRVLGSERLESGSGLNGRLGRGTGKWRLFVASDVRIQVMNLLESPNGHLSNLSTLVNGIESDYGKERSFRIPLFPSAGDAKGREGFVRVVNHSDEPASVRIEARDDSRWTYEPTLLKVDAGAAVQINPHDLETGNAAKGLPHGIGAGEGHWRLELSSESDIDVGAYMRSADGFLTAIHDRVLRVDGEYFVPTFNPGSNERQISMLRLVNSGRSAARVRIRAIDDRGKSAGDEVALYVARDSARTILARTLEEGRSGMVGKIGQGFGKWRLRISSNRPIDVMNLMESPTGHMVNLSARPHTCVP